MYQAQELHEKQKRQVRLQELEAAAKANITASVRASKPQDSKQSMEPEPVPELSGDGFVGCSELTILFVVKSGRG